MKLHFTYQEQHSSGEVINSHNVASPELEMDLVHLEKQGVSKRLAPGQETVLVILSGNCSIEIEGSHSWKILGERKDVFSGRATSVYIPPGAIYHITAGEYGVEIAAFRANTDKRGDAYIIKPEDVVVEIRGRGNWQREVHTILDSSHPAGKLLVGETFNEPGGWSSYPPHKHDVHNPPDETQLQEIYHFRIKPENGFGLQRIYSPENGIDEALCVRDGDSVFIPFGYHCVVAAAEYRLYYLWALAGNGRELRWHQDAAYDWITNGEASSHQEGKEEQ